MKKVKNKNKNIKIYFEGASATGYMYRQLMKWMKRE